MFDGDLTPFAHFELVKLMKYSGYSTRVPSVTTRISLLTLIVQCLHFITVFLIKSTLDFIFSKYI